ncbi:hypothetical protein ACP70R_026745 [Stipagrostis hirtigluma subsp. patula]
MRTEMVIRMQASSEKGHTKAMKVAAAIDGVESVTLTGGDKSLLLVIGDGVDCNHLTSRLRRKVGHADVVQLRTLQDRGRRGGGYAATTTASGDGGYYGGSHALAAYGRYPPSAPSYAPAPEYYQPQQPSYEYYHPAAPPYAATVAHREYYPGAADPNGCCIM